MDWTYFMKSAQDKHAATPPSTAEIESWPEVGRHESSDMVKAFFRNVTKPIKERYGGVPGIDYNSHAYADPIGSFDRVTVRPGRGTTFGGWYSPRARKISFSQGYPDEVDTVDVHETYHGLAGARPEGKGQWNRLLARVQGIRWKQLSGISERDREKLREAYGFEKEDLGEYYSGFRPDQAYAAARDEEHSTNGEYQYGIYRDLSERMGRPATYGEYARHVSEMPQKEIIDRLSRTMSAYMSRSLARNEGSRRSYAEGIPSKIVISSDADIRNVRNAEWYRSNEDVFKGMMEKYSPGGRQVFFPRLLYENRSRGKMDSDRAEKVRRAWLEVAMLGRGRDRRLG